MLVPAWIFAESGPLSHPLHTIRRAQLARGRGVALLVEQERQILHRAERIRVFGRAGPRAPPQNP